MPDANTGQSTADRGIGSIGTDSILSSDGLSMEHTSTSSINSDSPPAETEHNGRDPVSYAQLQRLDNAVIAKKVAVAS